jgi:phosphopentomutase
LGLVTDGFVKHQDLLNIPTRKEFHDLKEQVNGFKLSLMREIQNRDKGISLLAEQVAEFTARLSAVP